MYSLTRIANIGTGRRNHNLMWAEVLLVLVLTVLAVAPVLAEGEGDEDATGGQDRESMALDSTATQWSFQLAYQRMTDYHSDILDDGSPRPAGNTDYVQLRIVAPVPLKSFTLLPRLTFRHYENAAGESGMGNTELFALVIPKKWDWGTGRTGIGPLVTMPGSEKVARDEWGYGFAAAVVNGSGPWFYGLLLTQSWRGVDPTVVPAGQSDTNPLGIAPFLNFRIGKGWYVGNGDMVAKWDWDSSSFYLPLGVRVGNVLLQKKGSWNFYAEYQTSIIYDDWPGAAVDDSYRLNVTYTMPVSFGQK